MALEELGYDDSQVLRLRAEEHRAESQVLVKALSEAAHPSMDTSMAEEAKAELVRDDQPSTP